MSFLQVPKLPSQQRRNSHSGPSTKARVCYSPAPSLAKVDWSLCQEVHDAVFGLQPVHTVIVEHGVGKGWTMKQGQVCRISLEGASQVGDINMWNSNNPKERLFTGKTRQIHASHLTTYDRLWSNLPYLRPLATITGDSIQFGMDSEGAGVHDVIGTRCDPHTIKLMTGNIVTNTCHQNLTQAAEGFGLSEEDVHDVFNIFMCTGFLPGTGQYFAKGSPAREGDYIEWIADQDLMVALSACPFGDVSAPCGTPMEEIKGGSLRVQVFNVDQQIVNRWKHMNETL